MGLDTTLATGIDQQAEQNPSLSAQTGPAQNSMDGPVRQTDPELEALRATYQKHELTREQDAAQTLAWMQALREVKEAGLLQNDQLLGEKNPEQSGKTQERSKTAEMSLEDPLAAQRASDAQETALREKLVKAIQREMVTDPSYNSPDEVKAQQIVREPNGTTTQDLKQVLTDIREDQREGTPGVVDTINQELPGTKRQGVQVNTPPDEISPTPLPGVQKQRGVQVMSPG